jgi:fumarate reductase iron-sulfur subunit
MHESSPNARRGCLTGMTTELSISLWRGAQNGRYETYRVPQRQSQTVLDVVTFVQRHIDPTLSYRFACRVGVCGSCAMTVNGKPRWTCRTHVAKVAGNGKLEIGPLENLPVIKDLATDMQAFFEKWRQAKGAFVPTQTRSDPVAQIKPDTPSRKAADAAIECINCGVCYAACDTVRWNQDYFGPAALTRAWTLVNDERDASSAAHLQAVAGAGGCHSCHSHQSCQELCPQALNPTAAIAGLKRRTTAAYLKGEIKA